MKKEKNKNGFTLVELVVVLVILAILMAILVPSLSGYIKKAKKTACDVNMNYTYKALMAEYVVQYSKGNDALTAENIQKVMTKEMEGTVSGDGYAGICPSGGIYKVTAKDNIITVTCSKHGEGSGGSANDNVDSIMSSDTMTNYFYGSISGRTALDSTGPNFGGTAKKEIAKSLGLDPDSFDFRVWRANGSSNEYRLYISPSLKNVSAGTKVAVTGYTYTYNPAAKTWKRTGTGKDQEISTSSKTENDKTGNPVTYTILNAGEYNWNE